LKYTNILIIQTAFIGDAILASCLVEKMHAEFPDASITILVRKGNEGIYAGHPFLKEVLVWNKQSEKFKNLFKLLFQIRRNKYDMVINCHRYASSGFLTGFSGARHKAGYKQTPFAYLFDYAPKHVIGDGRHETERYHQLIADFASPEIIKPKIYPTAADEAFVKPYVNENYVCIAPSSVWFTKQLPLSKWQELLAMLPAAQTVYILGAASDEPMAALLIAASKRSNVMSLCGKLSLLQSAALMNQALMNYVNDSAPLHLASATNAPVTAFFCSTVKEFGFYPLSDNSQVIDAGAMSCRPCGLHGFKTCPKGHFDCGNKINISEAI
jgi:ADP-heptose:LPS heptosyltransferase